ncbi:MAG: antitoxin VapB family protein [Nanoarchaeota archaeon]|nr:antitoxin VapB family protein [Nanoarchaeota archaeon]MBU1501249.1 antitoxin VapB family protein [Nanoarchaeota archaeon]MBU2459136.1 antitoxin VapB family protein [Nanoarchaeota archaeon]
MSTHNMANINISIKEEAYRFLKSLKERDKSFSDVILEFRSEKNKRSGKSLIRFIGGLKDSDIDFEKKEKRIEKFRKDFDTRIEKTSDHRERS